MNDKTVSVRVWDLPTRTFHWSLALCVFGSLTSAWIGGDAMIWHLRFGYVVFSLVVFRLLWGFFGGHWSRFARFMYSPAASLRYMLGRSRPEERRPGLNPLGALSVLGLLVMLAAQVGSGLFADDEEGMTGPLNKFMASETASLLTRWHVHYGQWFIVAMVVMHIVAVFYFVIGRKQDLVRSMLSGDKLVPVGVRPTVDNIGSRMLALAVFLAAAGIVAWLVEIGD